MAQMNDAAASRTRRRTPPPLSRYRLLTSRLRVLPDFVILGGMRCGSTALYSYLGAHPQVILPRKKELHFLDRFYSLGTRWYRANFPTRTGMRWHKIAHQGTALTFEATPGYLFHPDAARRLSTVLPEAKLIALLRDPADRAYSHYQLNVHVELERHPFSKAIKREDKRLEDEREKILSDESYHSRKRGRYSYKARGLYLDQLRAYERYFSRDQLLVLKSEDLLEKTQETYDQVLRFLGLAPWTLQSTGSVNPGLYPREKPPGYEELREFYAPHNQRLYEYLGRDLGW